MTGGPYTILLVEDEERIRSELSELLKRDGFIVESAGSIREADLALERPFDLVLLDLGLPDGDGLDLCRSLRERHPTLPIVILTARDATPQVVRGLDLGADDYIVKPCPPAELVARVRSVLRRASAEAGEGQVSLGELWADPASHSAGLGDRRLKLRRREFDLMLFLLRHPGRAWTRDQLIDRVWGRDFEGNERTVDLYVRRLRERIESDPSDPRWIETVWGVGYRMNDAR